MTIEEDYLEINGKRYDLNIRGPCCDAYENLRKIDEGRIKASKEVTGKTPERVTGWYLLSQVLSGVPLILTDEKCPCNKSADPASLRKIFGKSLKDEKAVVKGVREFFSKLEEVAGDINK